MTKKLAKIISIYLIVTGIGFIASSDFYANMIAHKGSDPILINLSGMVHFFIGMTILANHFLWKSGLQKAVTIFGIMFLLKGTFLIALPDLTLQSGDNSAQIPWVMSLAFILIGSITAYFAFFSKK